MLPSVIHLQAGLHTAVPNRDIENKNPDLGYCTCNKLAAPPTKQELFAAGYILGVWKQRDENMRLVADDVEFAFLLSKGVGKNEFLAGLAEVHELHAMPPPRAERPPSPTTEYWRALAEDAAFQGFYWGRKKTPWGLGEQLSEERTLTRLRSPQMVETVLSLLLKSSQVCDD